MSQRTVRPFSTTSGVHPAYLPGLHRASRVEKKLYVFSSRSRITSSAVTRKAISRMLTLKRVPAAVATVGIGYGIAKYKQSQFDQQHAQISQTAAQRQAGEDVMMTAYGDRSSLAELEAAMKAYEQQRPQR